LNFIPTGCCIQALAAKIHIADRFVQIAVSQVTLKCAFFDNFHHPHNITAIITDSKKNAINHSIASGAQNISQTNHE
jgi:phage tail sheath gpL-like